MVSPSSLCWLSDIGRFQWYKAACGQGNPDFSAKHTRCNCRHAPRPVSRSRRDAIETVIRGARPDMLRDITPGDFHGRIGPSSRMTNGNPSVAGPVLHVTGLTKSYRTAGEEVAVLRGVNLVV